MELCRITCFVSQSIDSKSVLWQSRYAMMKLTEMMKAIRLKCFFRLCGCKQVLMNEEQAVSYYNETAAAASGGTMTTISEYKCPNCGGPLEFSSEKQKLCCPFCDSEYTVEEFNAAPLQTTVSEDDSWNGVIEAGQWDDSELAGLAEYICRSCGGTILTDKTTASATCPYCDNPVVMNDLVSDALRPEYVIPFKLNKDAARAEFEKHLLGKKLLPKAFTEDNHIDEIKGIYVPYWIFDADVDAKFSYDAKTENTWKENDEEVTETKTFKLFRKGTLRFEAIPVDASVKMPDDLMESIEPFDLSEAAAFNPGYLAGYSADRYSIGTDETIERARERLERSTRDIFLDTVSEYTDVQETFSQILPDIQARYVLYPVWILNTVWNDKTYTFAMNGQTGKFVGDLPIDQSAYRKWFALYGAGIAAAVYLLANLLH